MGRIIHGDCIEEMSKLKENSIDSIVCDSPYGLGFMGKDWDKFTPKAFQEFSHNWGVQALRILKPGSYLLNFSAPKKYHRMVCGLEDAGFTIKDMIEWIYGSGFPKSLNIGLAINSYLGGKIEKGEMIIAPNGQTYDKRKKIGKPLTDYCYGGDIIEEKDLFEKIPTTKEGKLWNGWGTGLKPAHEPIVVAQKPYEGTYAENVLKWGVGGINIDACRINYTPNKEIDSRIYNQEKNITRGKHGEESMVKYAPDGNEYPMYNSNKGRHPANLLLDPISSKMLDEQSGETKGDKRLQKIGISRSDFFGLNPINGSNYNDKGGASRFFYCGKAYKTERNAGLEDLEHIDNTEMVNRKENSNGIKNPRAGAGRGLGAKNDIATLKPINIMRYLVRLVTPPNGVVLDPFAGSGTTAIACLIEGFDYILIEKRERFAKLIIPKRLKYWFNPINWGVLKDHNLLPKINTIKNQKQNKGIGEWL